jgi:hypothetical protein
LKDHAPRLFRHMFGDKQRRFVMSRSLSPAMQREVEDILKWTRICRSKKSRRRVLPGPPSFCPRCRK